jgi:predicted DNA-binding ribbon-helix-helix protein
MPRELWEKVKATAERERRSVSNLVALILEEHFSGDPK